MATPRTPTWLREMGMIAKRNLLSIGLSNSGLLFLLVGSKVPFWQALCGCLLIGVATALWQSP